LEVSLQAFGACGNPNASPIARIALSGWEQGALAVSAIQAIREQSVLGLAAAKDVVDRCLAGENVQVETKDVDGASELAAKLRQLHFRAEVCFL
jgi:ribosomal protein L7/L12